MASSSTTSQIMALNSVYNQFADADKNDLKRKLAECQKDLKEAR